MADLFPLEARSARCGGRTPSCRLFLASVLASAVTFSACEQVDVAGVVSTPGGNGGSPDGGFADGATLPDGTAPHSDSGSLSCSALDVVFVVDRTETTLPQGEKLRAAAVGFAQELERSRWAGDFHVMVVDAEVSNPGVVAQSDGGVQLAQCDSWEVEGFRRAQCTCEPATSCCEELCRQSGLVTCNGNPCDPLVPDSCESRLGAGRVTSSDGLLCVAGDPRRYVITEDPSLVDPLSCVLEPGFQAPDIGRPVEALRRAISVDESAPGSCNDGFIREEAALLTILVTGKDDGRSEGNPGSWAQDLVRTKGGDSSRLVLVGILNDSGVAGGECDGRIPLLDSRRLREFVTELGPRGVLGSVCADDYSAQLTSALSILSDACGAAP